MRCDGREREGESEGLGRGEEDEEGEEGEVQSPSVHPHLEPAQCEHYLALQLSSGAYSHPQSTPADLVPSRRRPPLFPPPPILISSSHSLLTLALDAHATPPCRVRVTEVPDDAWSSASSDAGSDVDSVVSDSDLQLDLYDPSQETLKDRIYALKDMVPPTTRAAVSDAAASAKGWLGWSASKAGNAAWIVTTTALLVGMPLLLSIEGEAALVQQEKEYLAQVRPSSPSQSPFPPSPFPLLPLVHQP